MRDTHEYGIGSVTSKYDIAGDPIHRSASVIDQQCRRLDETGVDAALNQHQRYRERDPRTDAMSRGTSWTT